MFMKIEMLFNIIHYCIYVADSKRHIFFNKLNPFVLIGRIPAVKKKFEEQGTTHLEVTNKIWEDKRYGFSIMISGAGLVIVLFFIIMGVFDILNSIFKHPIKSSESPFLICAIVAYIICHFTVFKDDKYLNYFRQFSKWTKRQKWKYGLFSFVFVVGSFALFFYSFKFIAKF